MATKPKPKPQTHPDVLIVTPEKVYGPFPNVQTALDWIEAPHGIGSVWNIYSVWDREMGSAERAHECGTLLESNATVGRR